MSTTDFSTLPLSPAMLANIAALGYAQMTPIQSQALPSVLAGRDLLGQAKSGSGKTAAFGIGLLHKLDVQQYRVQALVLCPTRELAEQVSQQIRLLARAIPNTKITTLCGGTPIALQNNALAHPPHIVVGTPGRILAHLDQGTLATDMLQTLVLDEADRMLDMGFQEEILQIVDRLPKGRQTLLFSATYPPSIRSMSKSVLNRPETVRVESLHDASTIRQIAVPVAGHERLPRLIQLLESYRPESCIVFCNTKVECQQLADALAQKQLPALALHGDLEQKDRDQVLVRFANRSCRVLIATDVAARGLDINGLPMVINYEPATDPDVHIHRIGRTGRADSSGLALTLYTPDERVRIERIEQHTGQPIERMQAGKMEAPAAPVADGTTRPMVTLGISGGRKDKLRAGDILGALTANTGITGDQIGKIDILDRHAYVAVDTRIARQALKVLSEGKIKGRRFRVQKL